MPERESKSVMRWISEGLISVSEELCFATDWLIQSALARKLGFGQAAISIRSNRLDAALPGRGSGFLRILGKFQMLF